MNDDLYRKISSVWYYGLDLIWQSQDSFHPWNFLWINLWYFQSKPQLLGPSHLFQNTTLNTPLISRKYHFVTPVHCTVYIPPDQHFRDKQDHLWPSNDHYQV